MICLFLLLIPSSLSIYCTGLCATSTGGVPGDCDTGSPATCSTYDAGFFLAYPTTVATQTLIEFSVETQVSGTWTVGNRTAVTALSCTMPTFNITTVFYTYIYNFFAQLVSGDYLTRTITLPAHYEVRIKFTFAFIGVWSTRDYLNFTYNDSFSSVSQLLQYNCAST